MARRLISGLVALVACAGGIERAQADEFHFETFRYGQRAMGMGGAVTGQPFEPEASYYNPAGLALLDRGARFSGALNFLGYDRREQSGGLRDSGIFTPADLGSASFLPTPSSSVISARFADRHAIAFSTFLLGDLQESFTGFRDARVIGDPAVSQARFTSSFDRVDRLQLRGLTYAYAPSRRFSFGVSAFWLEQNRQESARRAQILGDQVGVGTLFIDVSSREKTTTHSLLARVGVAWRPTDSGSFGLSCSLPTLPLTGESTYGYTVITSGDGPNDALYLQEDETAEAVTRLPVNCRLGGALKPSPRWLLASDLSLHLPTSYQRFNLSDAIIGRQAEFRSAVTTDLTVNFAVGAEYRITERWPLRVGLFSNRTSAPAIPAAPDRFVPAHVDLYGATISAGYLGDRRSINLGLEVQYGQGEDVVSEGISSLIDSAEFARVDRTEWRVVVFVAGAAAFAKRAAVDIIKPVLEAESDDDQQKKSKK